MELPNEWLEFLSLLRRHDARFVIVGAYAMAAHGRPRASQDIDILIEPSVENAERVARALYEFGYPELAKDSVEAFTKTPRMASLGLPPLRIDIMNYIDGVPFERAYAGALQDSLGGIDLHFIGLSDFVATKKASGRPQGSPRYRAAQGVRTVGRGLIPAASRDQPSKPLPIGEEAHHLVPTPSD